VQSAIVPATCDKGVKLEPQDTASAGLSE